MTVFARKLDHSTAPTLDLPRVVAALIHAAIPIIVYHTMYNNLGSEFLSKFTTLVPISEERKALYMCLTTFYAIRWSFGMLTMMGEVKLGASLAVSLLHLFLHEMPYVVGSMAFYGAYSYDLTVRDYIAATLMVLAGILQHGSEAQRWLFKRNPQNKGQLHTGGLFRYARGINHTGHILRDLASCLFAPNPLFLVMYLIGGYQLAFSIFPATIEHMKKKYGEAYEKYEKQTPARFIPGIY